MEQLSYLHFPFLLRNGEVTGGPAGGWRWSVFITYFVLYIYHFSYINGCTATSEVMERAGNQEVIDSNLSVLPFAFFHISSPFFYSCSAWASICLGLTFLLFFDPLPCCLHPWPIYFSLLFLFPFFFISFYIFFILIYLFIFPKLKNTKKYYFHKLKY